SPNLGRRCRRPRLRSSSALRLTRPSTLQELLDQRPAQRRRGRLFDADLAAGDAALDLLDESLGEGLGRLVRRPVLPLPVLTVADVPVRLVLRASVENRAHGGRSSASYRFTTGLRRSNWTQEPERF